MLLSICPGPANLWPALLVGAPSFRLLSTLAAAREINRQRPVPVILLTGRHDVESLAWAAGSPVVKFLIKPVQRERLAGGDRGGRVADRVGHARAAV